MFKYLVGAITCLLVDLLIILTCWLWALPVAVLKLDALPGWLALLHTHDDDIYGSKTTGEPIPATVWKRWLRAMWWLCRNPGYGFQARVFGIYAGDVLDIIASPTTIEQGISIELRLIGGAKAWGYRRDLYWSKDRYIKMVFGWWHTPKAGFHMLKLDFNPFKKRGN